MSKGTENNNPVSVKTNLYWNTLVRIPVQILNLAISIVVARILMPRDFGILGIAMMLIGYANIFTNFGFNQAIVQKRIIDKKTLNSIFTFDLIISLFVASAFFFNAGLIAEFFKTPECEKAVRVMSSVFLITSFSALPHAMLRRNMDFKAVSLLDTSRSLLMSILTLVLAVKGLGYWALVYGQIIPLLLITPAYCIKARWIPSIYFSHPLMKQVYDFGIWNFLRSQVEFVSGHFDMFIVARLLGPVNLGFYDKSISIASVPYNSMLMNINAVMFASFSRSKEAKKELFKRLEKSIILISLICFPLYIGLYLVAPYFVFCFLGSKWAPMVAPFQIVLIGLLFKSLYGIVVNFNVGVGNYRQHSLRQLLCTVFFAAICFVLIGLGLRGIALSFLIYYLTLFITTFPLVISYTDASWQWLCKTLFPIITINAAMGAIVKFASCYVFASKTPINLFLLILIGSVSYIIFLLLSESENILKVRATIARDIKRIVVPRCVSR